MARYSAEPVVWSNSESSEKDASHAFALFCSASTWAAFALFAASCSWPRCCQAKAIRQSAGMKRTPHPGVISASIAASGGKFPSMGPLNASGVISPQTTSGCSDRTWACKSMSE